MIKLLISNMLFRIYETVRSVRSLGGSWNDSNAKGEAECPGRLCCLEQGDPERPSRRWRARHFCDNRPKPQSKF